MSIGSIITMMSPVKFYGYLYCDSKPFSSSSVSNVYYPLLQVINYTFGGSSSTTRSSVYF